MVALGFLAGGWHGRALVREGRPAREVRLGHRHLVRGRRTARREALVRGRAGRARSRGDAFELLTSRGGITWYGGFLGGTILGLWSARANKVPLLAAANCAAPSLAVGQALGRIGCFLVGDDYGLRSNVPWAVAFPEGLPPTIDPLGEVFRVHPTMLYETLWLLPVGAFLWWRRGRSPFLFGEYLMLAGIGRLAIETYRLNPDDDRAAHERADRRARVYRGRGCRLAVPARALAAGQRGRAALSSAASALRVLGELRVGELDGLRRATSAPSPRSDASAPASSRRSRSSARVTRPRRSCRPRSSSPCRARSRARRRRSPAARASGCSSTAAASAKWPFSIRLSIASW